MTPASSLRISSGIQFLRFSVMGVKVTPTDVATSGNLRKQINPKLGRLKFVYRNNSPFTSNKTLSLYLKSEKC